MSNTSFISNRLRDVARAYELLRGTPVEELTVLPDATAAAPQPTPTPESPTMMAKAKRASKGKVKEKAKETAPPTTPGRSAQPSLTPTQSRSPSTVADSPTSTSATSLRTESGSSKSPESPRTTVPSTTSSPVKHTKDLADDAGDGDESDVGEEELLCVGVAWHRIFGPDKTPMIRPPTNNDNDEPPAPKPQQSRSEFMASLYLSIMRSEEIVAFFGTFIYAYNNASLGYPVKLPRTLDEDHYVVRKLKRLEFLGSHAEAAKSELFGDHAHDDELALAYLRRLFLARPAKDDMWELKIIVAAHLWSAFNDKCHGFSKEALEMLTKLDMEFDAQRDEIEVDWAGIHTTLEWLTSGERADEEIARARRDKDAASSSSTAAKPATSSSSPSSPSASHRDSPFSKAFSPGFLKRGMSAGTSKATAAAPPKEVPEDCPKVTHPGYPWRLVGPPDPHRPVYCREIPLDHDMGLDAPPIEGLNPPPSKEILAAPGLSAMFSMPNGWAILGMEKVSARGDVGRVTIAPSRGVVKDQTGLFSVSGSFGLGKYYCPCSVCRAERRGDGESVSIKKDPAGKKESAGKKASTTANEPSTANSKAKTQPQPQPAKSDKKTKAGASTSTTAKKGKPAAATSDTAEPLPSAASDAGKAIIIEASRSPTGNALFDDPLRSSVGAAMLKIAMDRLGLVPDRDIWPLVPSPILDEEPSLRAALYQVLNVLLGGSVDRLLKDRCVETLEKLSQRLKSLSLSQQSALQRLRVKANFELAKHPVLKVRRDTDPQATPTSLRNKLLNAANDERERRSVYSMLQAGLCGALGTDHMLRKPLRGPAIIDLTCLDYSLVAWKPFTERAPGQGSFERGVRASPLAFRRYDPRKGWQRSWEPFEAHGSWPGTGWIRVYLEDVLDAPASAIDDNWEAAFKWVPERYFLRHVKPGSSADRWLGGFEENPALEELFGEGQNAHRWGTFDGAEVATLGGIIRDVEEKERGAAVHAAEPEKKGEDVATLAAETVAAQEKPATVEKATVTEDRTAPAEKEKPPSSDAKSQPSPTATAPSSPVKPAVCTKPECRCGRNKDTKRSRNKTGAAAAKQKEPKLKGREIIPDEPKPERKAKRMIQIGLECNDGPSSGTRHPPRLVTWPPTLCRCGGAHEDGKRKCGSRPLTAAQLREKEAKLERARREAEEARQRYQRSHPPPPPIMTPAAARERLRQLRDDLELLLDGKELPLDRSPDTKCSIGTGMWLLDSLIRLSQKHSSVVDNMRGGSGGSDIGKAFEVLELKLEETWGEELGEAVSRCVELVSLACDFIPGRRSSAEDAASAVFSRWIHPVTLAFATRQSRAGTDFDELLGEWDEVTEAGDAESQIAAMVDLTQRGQLHRLAERLDALASTVKPDMARNPHEVRSVTLLLAGGLKMLYRVNEVLKRLPADIVLTKTQYRRWVRKGRGGAAIPEEASDEEEVEVNEAEAARTSASSPETAVPVPQQQYVPRSASGKKQEKLHKRRSAGRCRMPLVKSPVASK